MSLNGPNFVMTPLFANLTDVKLVVKAADETVNNSNVLQDDDELVISGITALEVWRFIVDLRLQQADAAADWKFALVGPAGCSGGFVVTFAGSGSTSVVALDGTSYAITNTVTVETHCIIEGVLVNGGADGTLQLQWCQNTATVADNKVLANSSIQALRIKR